MNMRQAIIWLVLAGSIVGWSFITFRTLALSSGHLGPITVRWTRLNRPLPSVTTWGILKGAEFAPASLGGLLHRPLTIQPGSTVSFSVNTPAAFAAGTLVIQGDHGVGIYPSAGGVTPAAPTRLDVVWSKLSRTPAGYAFTIVNSATTPAILRAINITLTP